MSILSIKAVLTKENDNPEIGNFIDKYSYGCKCIKVANGFIEYDVNNTLYKKYEDDKLTVFSSLFSALSDCEDADIKVGEMYAKLYKVNGHPNTLGCFGIETKEGDEDYDNFERVILSARGGYNADC